MQDSIFLMVRDTFNAIPTYLAVPLLYYLIKSIYIGYF